MLNCVCYTITNITKKHRRNLSMVNKKGTKEQFKSDKQTLKNLESHYKTAKTILPYSSPDWREDWRSIWSAHSWRWLWPQLCTWQSPGGWRRGVWSFYRKGYPGDHWPAWRTALYRQFPWRHPDRPRRQGLPVPFGFLPWDTALSRQPQPGIIPDGCADPGGTVPLQHHFQVWCKVVAPARCYNSWCSTSIVMWCNSIFYNSLSPTGIPTAMGIQCS